MKEDHSTDIARGRYRLACAFGIVGKGTDKEKADTLLEYAISAGYSEPRERVASSVFKRWAQSKKAPGWAVRGAADLLLGLDYLPKNDLDFAVWMTVLIENKELSLEGVTSMLTEKYPLEKVERVASEYLLK